jgi:pimeloyl-ACP methyl ester carboxylesterase
MSVFVLIHGAWHDGSAWQATACDLEGRGHSVFAPTTAGHGKDVPKNVDHRQCSQSVVDSVPNEMTDVVLVGQSRDGTIISKVAEAIPQRIRRLVFSNAFVLRDGRSLMNEVPPHSAERLHQLHGRHRVAARRMGLASAHVPPPCSRSSRANARQPRGNVHEFLSLCGENH